MTFTKRTAVSVGLSLLFTIVYGSCNWFASVRPDVGQVCFAWEQQIPFVPWMIIPYMSINLFFVSAPFLCTSREELRTLSRRITFAILVAGACFLLFPLRFAFDRPTTTGWLGAMFDALHTFDQPHNLLPSLHITFRVILGSFYARHTRGVWRGLSHFWFSLIGISTLLTYQHHVIDVAGGFVLAVGCFYFFREGSGKLPVMVNHRIALRYAGGAVIAAGASFFFGAWGLLLLWPATSLLIVAMAYFGFGPGIYRKTNGTLALSARLLLAPCLLGQHLSLLYYRRRCHPWDEITPNVWIGRKLNNREASEAVRSGVTAVLDLTAEFDEAKPFLNLRYRNIPILDLTSPTQEQLQEIAEFIADNAAHGIVYVHCKIGYSRSAAAVGAYLLSNGVADVSETLRRLRSARPSIIVRPEVLAALSGFAANPRMALPV